MCPISYEPLKGKDVVFHDDRIGRMHPFSKEALDPWLLHTLKYRLFYFIEHDSKNKCIICRNVVNWSPYTDTIRTPEAPSKKMKKGILGAALVAMGYLFSKVNPVNQPILPELPQSLIAHRQCPNIHSHSAPLNDYREKYLEFAAMLDNEKLNLAPDEITYRENRIFADLLMRMDFEGIQFVVENELIDSYRFAENSSELDDRTFNYIVSRASEKDVLKMLWDQIFFKDVNRVAKLAKKLELIQKQNKTPERTVALLDPFLSYAAIKHDVKMINYFCTHYDFPLDSLNKKLLHSTYRPIDTAFKTLLKHGASIFSSEEAVTYAYKIGLLAKSAILPQPLIAHRQCPNIRSYPAPLYHYKEKYQEYAAMLDTEKLNLAPDEIMKRENDIIWDLVNRKDFEGVQFLVENELIDSFRFAENAYLADDRTFDYIVSRASEKDVLKMLLDQIRRKNVNRVAKLAKKLELIQKQNKTPERTVALLDPFLGDAVFWGNVEMIDYLCTHYDFPLDSLNKKLLHSTYYSTDTEFKTLLKHGASIFSSQRAVEYAYKIRLLSEPTIVHRFKNYFNW